MRRALTKIEVSILCLILGIGMLAIVSAIPQVTIDRLFPTTDVVVNKSTFFNVTVNVSCLGEACDQINVTLDPPGQPASCKELLDLGFTTSGVYTIYPNSSTGFSVYCDQTTDGGGWTLVSSIYTNTLDDKNGSYHSNLTTLNPTNTTADGIWGGLRGLAVATNVNNLSSFQDDIRFSCKTTANNNTLAVDLAFYDIGWYYELTNSSSEGSVCFEDSNGLSDTQPTPARQNLKTGANLTLNDQYGATYLEGEDGCASSDDFSIDFDDRGMDSTQDSTDWGEDDGLKECGTVSPTQGSWFIWYREGANYTGKNGAISTNSSAVPFYTNVSNPYQLNLSANTSQVITWWVNASGAGTVNYTFFVYANLTANMSITNRSTNWTVTLFQDSLVPNVTITYPGNTSYASSPSELNYSVSSDAQACWYSTDGGITNTSITCGTNITGLSASSGSNTWRVAANDSWGNINTSRITFVFDNSVPGISFGTRTATNGSSISGRAIYANVSVSITNQSVIIFSLFNTTGLVNRSTFTASTRVINWTNLHNGTFYYNVSINNSLGVTNTTELRTILLDNGRPVVNLLTPTNGTSTLNSTLSFSFNTTDDYGLTNATLFIYNSSRALINRTVMQNMSGLANATTLNYTFTSSGTFFWNILVTDAAGNMAVNRTNRTLLRPNDTAYPQISFVSPTTESGNYSASTLTARVSASDAYLQSLTIRLYNTSGLYQTNTTSATSTSMSYTISYAGLPQGRYFLNASASDTNSTNNTLTKVIVLDTTVPTINLVTPINTTNVSSSTYNFTFNGTDNLATELSCGLYLDNIVNYDLKATNTSTLTNTNTVLNSSGLQNKTYTWYVSCNDTAGNRANSSIFKFTQDAIKPTITIIQPANSSFIGGLLYLTTDIVDSLAGIGAAQYTISNRTDLTQVLISGPLNASGNWDVIWNSSLYENLLLNLTLKINATDTAGNMHTSFVNFTLDNVNPTIQIISPGTTMYRANFNLSVISQDPSLQFVKYNVTDSNGGLKQGNSTTVSSTTNHNWSEQITLEGLSEGNYTLTTYANDSVGNIRVLTFNFTYDASPPTIALNGPASSLRTSATNVTFNWTVTDGVSTNPLCNLTIASLTYVSNLEAISGQATTYFASGFTYGARYWNVTCMDNAGNRNTSATQSFTLGFADRDGDGIPDDEDRINGDYRNVTKSGISNLTVHLNTTTNTSTFAGIGNLSFYDGETLLFSATHNFTQSEFDLTKVQVQKGSHYLIINLSSQLQTDHNKTIYFSDENYTALCLEDYEIENISEISDSCDGLNEYNITTCLGNENGTLFSEITCTDLGSTIKLENLRYSAVTGSSDTSTTENETTPTTEQAVSGGVSGGAGKCVNTWECTKWSFCSSDVTQVRTCALEYLNGCSPTTAKPAEKRVCPDILFDIFVDIDNARLYPWEDLEAEIILTEVNYSELVDVQLTYRILQDQKVVYEEIETRAVEKSLKFEKEFDDLSLEPGTYALQVTILYGIKQMASAAEPFMVLAAPFPFGVLFLSLAIMTLLLVSYLGHHLYKKKKENHHIEQYLKTLHMHPSTTHHHHHA